MAGYVGTAYVRVVPAAKGFVKSVAGESSKAGTEGGKAFEGAFGSSLGPLNGALGAVKGAISGVVKATVAGGAAMAGAFGVAAKSALDAYATYEQVKGGVETLFKDAAPAVIQNAQAAYKSAGMSANAYMTTVTGFSASLLKSLGGDTAKAAGYADRAVRDMSDNANKMGTNIVDIQNAYQGFAKQNYTMLDNLKLGRFLFLYCSV